jgi:hypothetical protein
MSIAEMNAALGRLYVDEHMRRLFAREPDSILGAYRLSDAEAAAIVGIDRERLELFADGLLRKKHGRMMKTYEATRALNPERFDEYFRRFYGTRTSYPGQRPGEYTSEFGLYLEQSFTAELDEFPPYALDLVRFERELTRAQATARGGGQYRSGAADTDGKPVGGDAGADVDIDSAARPATAPGVVLCHFAFDVAALRASLREGGELPQALPDEHYIAFHTTPDMSAPKTFRLNPKLGLLMRRCDGARTVAGIAEGLETDVDGEDRLAAVLGDVRRLVRLGLLAGA